MEQQSGLEKIIVIILHKKEDEKRVKQQSLDLQTRSELGKYQIIRNAAEDTNFNTVYEQLKKSVEHMIQKTGHTLSLSKFTEFAKEDDHLDEDNARCYYGYMVAESILK